MTSDAVLDTSQAPAPDESPFLHYVLPFEGSSNRVISGDLKASQSLLDDQFGSPKLAADKNYVKTLLFTKLPSEHPSSPEDAADRAIKTIENMGANQFGYAEANLWLNDGNSQFRAKAADHFNSLQLNVFSADSNELCFLQAEKQDGVFSISETSAE